MDKTQALWPENVVARYLTVGGATVDLVEKSDEITGSCNGCPNESHSFHFDPCCTGDRMEQFVTSQATGWAQTHAGKCRAMPKPGA